MSETNAKIWLNTKRFLFILFMIIIVPFMLIRDLVKGFGVDSRVFIEFFNPTVWWEASREIAIRGKWRIEVPTKPDELPKLVFPVYNFAMENGNHVYSCHRKQDVVFMMLKYGAVVTKSPKNK